MWTGGGRWVLRWDCYEGKAAGKLEVDGWEGRRWVEGLKLRQREMCAVWRVTGGGKIQEGRGRSKDNVIRGTT